jgi:ketosteroid isomerase-like protein
MSEEQVEFVRRSYDPYNAGDLEGVIRNFHEDVEVYVPASVAPIAGTYRGHDGVRKWYREWRESFDEYTAEVREIEPIGDRHVVTLAHQSAKGKGSGVPVETDFGNLFEIRTGKVVALHVYPTYREAVEIAKRREAGEPDAKG